LPSKSYKASDSKKTKEPLECFFIVIQFRSMDKVIKIYFFIFFSKIFLLIYLEVLQLIWTDPLIGSHIEENRPLLLQKKNYIEVI